MQALLCNDYHVFLIRSVVHIFLHSLIIRYCPEAVILCSKEGKRGLVESTTTTIAVLWPFVRDYPDESVPEETFTHSPILIIIQPLSASSIYYDPLHLPCSIFVDDRLIFNCHINNIVARASARANLIHKCL